MKAKEVVAMSPICIAKVLPHMQRMRLHLSGRADQHNFFLFCELCRPLKLIKELHVLLSSADAPPMQITFDINWLGACSWCQCVTARSVITARQRISRIASHAAGAHMAVAARHTFTTPERCCSMVC